MSARRLALVLPLAIGLAACGPESDGRRPIPAGAACAVCGMEIRDRRYACEDERHATYRFYDSIECLLQAEPPAARVWLADYDTESLHAADSVWVVRAALPSPMGGGYASFSSRAAAGEVAELRQGRVGRLDEFRAPGPADDAQAGEP